MTRVAGLGALALACSLAASAPGATPLPPKPTRYATDRAGVFEARRLAALNQRLAAFATSTSSQVIVYVDRRLPAGTTLEEMSAAALRAWGVGQKSHDNGVIFFVFVDDRVMRIEVGYGLEGAIPDAVAARITGDTVKPFFKRGDFAGGVEAGVDRLLSAARGEAFPAPPPPAEAVRPRVLPAARPLPPPDFGLSWTRRGLTLVAAAAVTLVILLLVRVISRRSVSEALGSYFKGFMATWGALGGLLLLVQGDDGLLAVAVFVAGLICLVLDFSGTSTSDDSSTSDSSSSSYDSSSSDSSTYSSSSSDTSSTFSGGGGDGGGGGASDRW